MPGSDLACTEAWQPLWFRGLIQSGSEHLGVNQKFSVGKSVPVLQVRWMWQSCLSQTAIRILVIKRQYTVILFECSFLVEVHNCCNATYSLKCQNVQRQLEFCVLLLFSRSKHLLESTKYHIIIIFFFLLTNQTPKLCLSSVSFSRGNLMNGSVTILDEVTQWWSERDGSLFGFFRWVHRLDKRPH